MSFKNDLANQIRKYVQSPENIIDEVIADRHPDIDSLTEKQMADICAVRRSNRLKAQKFPYSLEELDLIIATVDSDPFSGFARLRDAIRQIEFILDEENN